MERHTPRIIGTTPRHRRRPTSPLRAVAGVLALACFLAAIPRTGDAAGSGQEIRRWTPPTLDLRIFTIQSMLGHSNKTGWGDGADCYYGRSEILYKLDTLRELWPELFQGIDYGPVYIPNVPVIDIGHAGVVIYRSDKGYTNGMVIEYTNFVSDITTLYMTRPWWEWAVMGGKKEDRNNYLEHYYFGKKYPRPGDPSTIPHGVYPGLDDKKKEAIRAGLTKVIHNPWATFPYFYTDNPDDNVNVASRVLSIPGLYPAYLDLAKKKGIGAVADLEPYFQGLAPETLALTTAVWNPEFWDLQQDFFREELRHLQSLPPGGTGDGLLSAVQDRLAFVGEVGRVPDVALLDQGWYTALSSFLAELKEPTAWVDSSFDPSLAGHKPLLVLDSGALMGLGESALFRRRLEDYAAGGGTLLVFTQRHGADFAALPGGRVGGFGWAEDQACQFRSTALNTYLPFFAAMPSATPDLNVDGYFTSWPEDAQVLMRRTANDQPCLIAYPWGSGRVIATTLYGDWAYANHQMSGDERRLIRDLVRWSKAPGAWDAAHEGAPGDTIRITVTVANPTGADAADVHLLIRDPDGTVRLEMDTGASVPAGVSTSVPLEYTLPGGVYGIYRVDASLRGDDGQEIFRGVEAAFFAASRYRQNPDGFEYRGKDVTFSAQSDEEEYLPGETARYTLMVFDNGDLPRRVRVRYWLPHFGGTGGEATVEVAPHASVGIPYDFTFPAAYGLHSLWADFWDADSGEYLGRALKSAHVIRPAYDVTVSTGARYREGETVEVRVDLTNRTGKTLSVSGQVEILGAGGALTATLPLPAEDLPPFGAVTRRVSLVLPSSTPSGDMAAAARLTESHGLAAGASASFTYRAGDGTLRGTVRDLTGNEPVAGAAVRAFFGAETWETVTDADGVFSLTLPGAPFWVTVTADGYYRTGTQATVRSGETTSLVVYTSPVSGEPPEGMGRLAGQVLSLFDELPTTTLAVTLAGDFGSLETDTGSGGEFSFIIPPGAYTLGVRFGATVLLSGVPADLAAGERKFVDLLVRSGEVAEPVRNLVTGEAIPGATVSLDGGALSTGTDDQGRYRAVLTEGIHTVRTEAEGFLPAETRIYASSRRVENDSVYLLPDRPVPVTVTVTRLVGGESLAGALVSEPNAILSGSEDPGQGIVLDNGLLIHRNGTLVADVYHAGGGNVGTVPLHLSQGDGLSIVAYDKGGVYYCPALWLHDPAGGRKVRLSDAVPNTGSGFSHTNTSLLRIFLEATHTVAWPLGGEEVATGLDGTAVIHPMPGLRQVVVQAENRLHTLDRVHVAPDRPVGLTVPVDTRRFTARVQVRQYRPDQPVAGAVLAVPNVMLGGGESPDTGISLDNRLLVSVNGHVVHDVYSGGGGNVGGLFLHLRPGDTVRVTATDKGGAYYLSDLWAHNLFTGARLKIADGVPSTGSGFPHTSNSREKTFLDRTWTVPADAPLLTRSTADPVTVDAGGWGEVTVQGVPDGSFFQRLLAWAPGYSAHLVHYQQWQEEATAYLETLRAPVAGRLRDLVTDAPVAGATVVLDSGSDREAAAVTSDGEGIFRGELARHVPEVRTVTVTRDGYAPFTGYLHVSPSLPVDTDARTGNYTEFYLEPDLPVTVQGTLRRLDDDAPLAGATLLFDGGPASAVTGEDGTWSASLPLGHHAVQVSAGGFLNLSVGIHVTQRTVGTTWYLRPVGYTPPSSNGSVTFRVFDAVTGTPVGGVSLDVYGLGWQATDGDGVLTRTHPGGTYRLHTTRPDYHDLDFNPWVAFFPGRTVELPLWIRPVKGSVRFTLLDRVSGNALGGSSLDVFSQGWTGTDAQGQVTRTVPAGSYRVHTTAGDRQDLDFSPWITFFPGRTVEIPIQMLPSKGTVTFRDRDLISGLPLQGAAVDVFGGGVSGTDADGLTTRTQTAGYWRIINTRANYHTLDLSPWACFFPGKAVLHPMRMVPVHGTVVFETRDLVSGLPIQGMGVDVFGAGWSSTDAQGLSARTATSGPWRIHLRGPNHHDLDFSPWVTFHPGTTTRVTTWQMPIQGTVTFHLMDVTTGQPLQGVGVDLYGAGWSSTDAQGHTTRTQTSGNWRVHTQKPGWHDLDFSPWATLWPGRASEIQIPVWPNPAPPGGIAGRVVDQAGGGPLPAAVLTIDGAPVALGADASFSRTLTPGTHPVRVEAAGFQPLQFTFYSYQAKVITRDLALAPLPGAETTLTVSVTDLVDGLPLPGAAVTLIPAAGGTSLQGTTPAGGRLDFTLASGVWRVEIIREGYASFQETLSVPADGGALSAALTPLGEEVPVPPASFQLTGVAPAPLDLFPGGEVRLEAYVANTGGTFGTTEVGFTLPGLFQGSTRLPLNPGQEATVPFAFSVPEDLDRRAGTALLTVDGERREIPFTVEGAVVEVNASLDAEFYKAGETALLTLAVTNRSPFALPAQLRVQLGDWLEMRPLDLPVGGSGTEVFSVPVVFDGNKLTFGVYHVSGRALHLDAWYLPEWERIVRVAAERQQYAAGEAARFLVEAQRAGKLTFDPPEGWTGMAPGPHNVRAGTSTIDFTLPAQVRTGSYQVPYTFTYLKKSLEGSVPVDVRGSSVKVTETRVEAASGPAALTADFILRAEADPALETRLEWLVQDPLGGTAGSGWLAVSLAEGPNDLSVPLLLEPGDGGTFTVYWSFTATLGSASDVIMASGSQSFDVEDSLPPQVRAFFPRDGAGDVPPGATVSVTFSETMDHAAAQAAFSLDPPAAGAFTWVGETMVFTPAAPLASLTAHAVSLGTGARDTSGNPLASPLAFAFTTGDARRIFFDDFTHGTSAGDGDFQEDFGDWSVVGGRFVSSPKAARNVAVLRLHARDFRSGRLEAQVQLAAAPDTVPNASLVFGYRRVGKKLVWRYVQLSKGKVTIGETGGPFTARKAAVTVGPTLALRVDVHDTGLVKAYLGDRLVAQHKFTRAAAGSVGLAAARARSSFDDYAVWDAAVLP